MAHKTHYSPLDESRNEIRLVVILPSNDDDETISCKIQNVSLNEQPEYAALSYVWGDQAITKDIIVNGLPFAATTNLGSALWHMRKYGITRNTKGNKKEEIPIWVDAICINQNDTQERNQQVTLMGSIYGCANFVVSWLGMPGKWHIDDSLRWINSLSQALPTETSLKILQRYDRARSLNQQNDGDDQSNNREEAIDLTERLTEAGLSWISSHPELHDDGSDTKSNPAWHSFTALNNLSYWERIWIVQERVLSKSFDTNIIRCGTEVSTLKDFILFFTFILTLDGQSIRPPEIHHTEWQVTLMSLKTPIVKTTLQMRILRKSGDAFPGRLLQLAELCQATDARDMVYGVKSLLNLNIKPDYNKSVREVYLEWHSEIINDCSGGDEPRDYGIGWAGVGLYKENPYNLPSWLPDLSMLYKRAYIFQPDWRTYGQFATLSVCKEQYSGNGVLGVDGVLCSQVTVTTMAMNNPDDLDQAVCDSSMEYVLNMKGRRHPTGIRPLQAWYYTLHQGIDPDTKQKFTGTLDPESYSAQTFRCMTTMKILAKEGHDWSWADLDASGGLGGFLETQYRDCENKEETERWRQGILRMSEEDHWEYAMLLLDVQTNFENKTVFFTADGYIGVGPQYMTPGDTLCVINNCSLPVLLRIEDAKTVLVGAAYVYGLSDGEPLDMVKLGRLKIQRFDIS
ncbi:hypothetical protein VE03_09406 [Pseudogymnoascus sp. 23342-1-I1]|nr:hypothetical protein VE03_09406 [Pseudogymnoascus sp. 23342-1-I1]